MTAPADDVDVLDAPGAGALVVRGGALRIAGFALGTVLSLAGVVAVTRHLGVVDYGRYQAVTALVAIVTALGDLGLGTLALREYAQVPTAGAPGAEVRRRGLEALLGLRVALAAAGVGVAAAVAAALGYDATMVAGAALAAGAGVLLAGQQTATVPLQSALRIGTVTALDVGRQAATTGLMLALVAAGAGLLWFLAIPVPVALGLVVATVAVLGRRVVPRPVVDRAAWPRLLRDAVPVGLATASGVLYLYASLIVCELVATPRETGAFSASFRVIVIVAAVPALLGTSAFPLLARAAATAPERFARATAGLVEGSVLLGGAAALGAILGAPAIVAVVAGDGFDAAIGSLRIQGAALALTFAISGLGFALLARHRQRVLLGCNLLAFAVTAAAVALLAAAHGERGAALGAVLGEATLCTAYVAALARDVPIRPARVPRIVLALAGALALGALLPVPAVPATAIGLAAYAALLWALRAIPPELRALVR